MSRGWRLYFASLVVTFVGLTGYGVSTAAERNAAMADQLAQRVKLQHEAKTRVVKRDNNWPVYPGYQGNILQNALEQSRLAPARSRMIGPGDFPLSPDGP